jgi:hypothetical protein
MSRFCTGEWAAVPSMDAELPHFKTHVTGPKWQTIRFALESWARTARLCVVMFVMSAPVDTLAWLVLRR